MQQGIAQWVFNSAKRDGPHPRAVRAFQLHGDVLFTHDGCVGDPGAGDGDPGAWVALSKGFHALEHLHGFKGDGSRGHGNIELHDVGVGRLTQARADFCLHKGDEFRPLGFADGQTSGHRVPTALDQQALVFGFKDQRAEVDSRDRTPGALAHAVFEADDNGGAAVVALETMKRMGKLKLSDYMVLGDLYHNLELYDQSLQVYEEAIQKKQKLPLLNYVRVARILIGRGSYQDGFSYLEKIELNFGKGYSEEDEKKIRLLQAEVLRATGKDQKASDILLDLAKKFPLEGKIHFILGQIAWKKREFVEAELRFERAAKDPELESSALLEHARMLVSNQDYQKAVGLLERVQDINPQKRVEKYLNSVSNLLISSRIRL